MDLAFGDRFRDSAYLKRAVEAANASLLAPDLLPSGDIDAASLVNSRPEKPRVSPVAVASAHAVLAEAKRQRAVRDKQRKNRRGKKKKLLPVTEQL